MPSSLIFVGLIVLWLLILVPTVARRQQEVARLSPALLSGRVLERPKRHRYPEVDLMERSAPSTVGEFVEARDDVPDPRGRDDGRVYGIDDDDLDDEFTDDPEADDPEAGDAEAGDAETGEAGADTVTADPEIDGLDAGRHGRERDPRPSADGAEDDGTTAVHHDPDDELEPEQEWDHPPARYRPGRGGFDPEAAAAAAHAKYAFRQRVVLALLVLLVAAGATALLVSTVFWWVAGALGLGLAGYLTYLRRQVRIEESIRARRAARLTGRRAPVAGDVGPDVGPERAGSEADEAPDDADARDEQGSGHAEDEVDWTADDGEPSRVRGTGEPLGVLPGRRRTVEGPASTEHESSLPRLVAGPPPPAPAGTSLVDMDADDEPDVLDDLTPHRRAVGE